jgi:hypothetical protein
MVSTLTVGEAHNAMVRALQDAGLNVTGFSRAIEVSPKDPGPCQIAAILVEAVALASVDNALVRVPDDTWLVRVFCQPRAGEGCLQVVDRQMVVGRQAVVTAVFGAQAARWFRGQCVVEARS